MPPSARRPYFFGLFLVLLLATHRCLAQTLSIAKDSALLQQRNCVQLCLAGGGSGLGHKDIADGTGCARTDSCVCRENLRSVASSYISSCIYSDFSTCSDGPDYTSAVSVFDGYCGFKAPATVVVTPTAGSSSWNNQPATVTLYTSAPTATVTVRSSSATPLLSSEWLAVVMFSIATLFSVALRIPI